ncbi:MAG: N-acetylmuramoyl-L-alanine amidase, family 2 [Cyanobacteria bacterium RYN_339]|nr:N-acetylmuramoyl-L-alanine amidase, family 2 [Cyanobacteria bacterium RYN_339]
MKKTAVALVLGTLLIASCGRATLRGVTPSAGALRAHAVDPVPMTETLSPNFNERGDAPISCIVLHHTAVAATAQSTANFFADPKSKVSAHFVVDRDGSVIRCVADDKRAWHAGKSAFNGVNDVNTFSLGIEIANVGDNVEPYPEAQVTSVVKLVAYLAKSHDIPMANVTRHRDVALPAGRKTDTSDNFDHKYVIKAAQALIDGTTLPRYTFKPAPEGYDARRQVYTVKPGDTWEGIADGVFDAESMASQIIRMNLGAKLTPGAHLRLPSTY